MIKMDSGEPARRFRAFDISLNNSPSTLAFREVAPKAKLGLLYETWWPCAVALGPRPSR
jgi:hypothetical protein